MKFPMKSQKFLLSLRHGVRGALQVRGDDITAVAILASYSIRAIVHFVSVTTYHKLCLLPFRIMRFDEFIVIFIFKR